MYQALRTTIDTVSPVTEEDWNVFTTILRPVSFAKGDTMLSEGHVCRGIYFVNQGAFRTYHLKGGNEIHTAFYFENDFVQDIASLTHGTPSQVNIVALEEAQTLFMPKDDMLALYERAPSFQRLGREVLALMAISEKKYVSLFTDFQPKERYEYVVAHYSELIQRVPLQYLASFLGVARETLSRIRKRVR